MMKVACPYCGTPSEEGTCESCRKSFNVGCSDGNQHSFSEIFGEFPQRRVMGEFSLRGYRIDQFHCSSCGLVTEQRHEICPTLIAMALSSVLDQEALRFYAGEGMDPAMTKARLEKFLASQQKLLTRLWTERDFRKRFQPGERKAVESLMGLAK